MPEKTQDPQTQKSDDPIKKLEGAEATELDEESLEDVAGGNENCNNTQCCGIEEQL